MVIDLNHLLVMSIIVSIFAFVVIFLQLNIFESIFFALLCFVILNIVHLSNPKKLFKNLLLFLNKDI